MAHQVICGMRVKSFELTLEMVDRLEKARYLSEETCKLNPINKIALEELSKSCESRVVLAARYYVRDAVDSGISQSWSCILVDTGLKIFDIQVLWSIFERIRNTAYVIF